MRTCRRADMEVEVEAWTGVYTDVSARLRRKPTMFIRTREMNALPDKKKDCTARESNAGPTENYWQRWISLNSLTGCGCEMD